MKNVCAEFDNGYHTGCEDNYYMFDDNVDDLAVEDHVQEEANEYFSEWEYLTTGWDNEFDSIEDEGEYWMQLHLGVY